MLWICILALAIYGIVNEIRQRKRERREETACGVIEQRSIERARKAAEERDEIRRTADRREKELAAWRASVEKEQKKIEAAQRKQRAEQERQKKEQERQAAQLSKHEAQINKMYARIEKCEDDIAHFSELADVYTAQRDKAQSELDTLRERLSVANGGLDPAEIAHGDMSKWEDTSDPEKFMEAWSKAYDDGKKGKKAKTSDIDKMQKKADSLENKIIRLNNQIYSAEQRVKKAAADKYQAEAALGA